MKPEDLQKLKDAFNAWAANDPHPRRPIIQTLSGKSYTSRQLAEGLATNNEIGQHVIKMVESYIAHGDGTLEDIIADFGAPQAPPAETPPAGLGSRIKSALRNVLHR